MLATQGATRLGKSGGLQSLSGGISAALLSVQRWGSKKDYHPRCPGIYQPLPAPRLARRLCAYPPLWLLGQPLQKTNSGSMPQTAQT